MKVKLLKAIKYQGKYPTVGSTIDLDIEESAIRDLIANDIVSPAESISMPEIDEEIIDETSENIGDSEDSEDSGDSEDLTVDKELCIAELTQVDGVKDVDMATILFDNGFTGIDKLREASKSDLVALPTIGKKTAETILADMVNFIEE